MVALHLSWADDDRSLHESASRPSAQRQHHKINKQTDLERRELKLLELGRDLAHACIANAAKYGKPPLRAR